MTAPSTALHADVLQSTLHLPLNGIYFDQIASGEKVEEYRLATPYWHKRLVDRLYDQIVLTRGYPKGGGVEGETRLTRPWRGWDLRTITHPHFGPQPVEVFAIHVQAASWSSDAIAGWLTALADRVEASSGFDRDLDVLIAKAVGYRDIYGDGSLWDRGNDGYWSLEPDDKHPALPSFTSSLDDAMTLIRDDAEWNVHRYQKETGRNRRFTANITHWPEPPFSLPLDTIWHGKGNSAALALTAAALRARESS